MTSSGFQFRYCIGGGPPAIRRFSQSGGQGLVPGDMVSFNAGVPALAMTGDVSFLGCVIEPEVNRRTDLEVIAAEDAVYGVADRCPRAVGAHLDLAGGSGAQTVAEAVNDDFEVVAEATADEETLLRITLGKHCSFVVDAAAGEAAPTWPRLTPVRERELVLAAAAGEPSATEELINAFLPAIAGVARLYRSAPVDRAELLQEGVVGLLRATRRFDPSLGSPFWAYAAWWVRQAMQQLVSELTRPIVLSDRAQRGLAHIREARRGYFQAHGREPTAGELAALVELSRDQVESLLAAERAAQPLQMPAEDDHGHSGGREVLADPGAEEEFERIISRLETERIRDLAKTLTAREREILRQHYGIEGAPKTLREIGAALGISAERVRQIDAGALEKLRTAALEPQT